MAFLTQKKATSTTPQVVTLIVDDSNSMNGDKAKTATESAQDLVITMQSGNPIGKQRFLVNIAAFGTQVTPMVVAAFPPEVVLGNLNFSGTSGQTEMAEALRWA